jgi:hypothetical protein
MVLATGSHTATPKPQEASTMTIARHIITAGAAAITLAAGAAPASARFFDITPNGSYVPAGTQAVSPSAPPSTPAAVVRVTAGGSGFDWADAGIGAAGGLAISMVGLGGSLVVSQRRSRRIGHTAA